MESLQTEIKILFPELESFSFADVYGFNKDESRDTTATFFLIWNEETEGLEEKNEKLEKWLRTQISREKMQVVNAGS